MAINLPYPLVPQSLPSYNLNEIAAKYEEVMWRSSSSDVNPAGEIRLDGSSYFPRPNIDRLKELANNVSDDEARQILSVLLTEATKENGIVLSKSVIDALVLMVTDSCGGPPEGVL